MSKIIKPDTDDVLAQNDTSKRLDTGMTAKEAIMRAKNWWENVGQAKMRQHALRQRETIGGSNNGAGAEFASKNPDSINFMPAGFIHAKPWDELDKRDQRQLVKVWHHFNIRKPDLLGEDQATHKMQDRGKIQ